jgi:hypothetical protein
MKLLTRPVTIFSFSLLVLSLSLIQSCSIIQKFAPELLESEIPSSEAKETLNEVTERQAKEYLAQGRFISKMDKKINCYIANTRIFNEGKEVVNVISPKNCSNSYGTTVSSLFVVNAGQNSKDFKLVRVTCQHSIYERIMLKQGADRDVAYYESANSETENAAYRPRLINGFPSCPDSPVIDEDGKNEVHPVYKDYSITEQERLSHRATLERIDTGTDRQAQEFSKFGKYITSLPNNIKCTTVVSELKDDGNTVMNYISPTYGRDCSQSLPDDLDDYKNGLYLDGAFETISAVFAVKDQKNQILKRSRIICQGQSISSSHKSYESKADHPHLVNGVPRCGLDKDWKVFKMQQYPPIPIR